MYTCSLWCIMGATGLRLSAMVLSALGHPILSRVRLGFTACRLPTGALQLQHYAEMQLRGQPQQGEVRVVLGREESVQCSCFNCPLFHPKHNTTSHISLLARCDSTSFKLSSYLPIVYVPPKKPALTNFTVQQVCCVRGAVPSAQHED
jgi:hypothetical protein